MEFQEVSDVSWVPRLVEFDESLNDVWICDSAAVEANNIRHMSTEAMTEYMQRDKSTVVVALHEDEIVAFVVGDDDSDGRGGCRGRWVALKEVSGYEVGDIYKGLLEVLADKYGWVWGRITNPLIKEISYAVDGNNIDFDETLFSYKGP